MEIPLRNDKDQVVAYALVDEQDYQKVNARRWYREIAGTRKDGSFLEYARGNINHFDKIFMHQFILGDAPIGHHIDHINHNGLDNRKSVNLRFATFSQNSQNIVKREGTASQYKGCTYEEGKWRAKIAGNHLGRFIEEIDAGRAYDKAAFQLFGEHASHNNLMTIEEKQHFLTVPFTGKKYPYPKGVEPAANGQFYARVKSEEFGRETFKLNTMEGASAAYQKRNEEIKAIRQKAHDSLPISRDSKGRAVIALHNKNKETTHYMVVCDEDWHWLSTHSWFFHKRHPATSIDRKYMTISQVMNSKNRVWTGEVYTADP